MQRPAAPTLTQANFLLLGALVFGLLLAVFLGFGLGESDYGPLLIICLASVAISFVVGLYKYVWQIALFLFFVSFTYRPTDFAFGAVELSCALGFVVVGLFFWQKKKFDRPAILDRPSFRLVEGMLFVWLGYAALHLIFNVEVPVSPGEFKLSNALKSYFGLSAPLLLLFLFARFPGGLVARKDFFWTVGKLCLLGLLLNLGLRINELSGGWPPYIPVLNATWESHALRAIGPMAMLIGIVGMTGEGRRGLSLKWFIFCTLLVLGTVGSILSGGRGVVVFGFLEVCTVLFLRRKIGALGVVLFIGIVGIAVVNLSSSWINEKANPFLQRSVQWLMIEKNWETVESLESSTDWRKELAHRAFDEWRSNPRIFWTGRATFGFGSADETAILIAGGYEALIETSLRRGATHNLTTDLLIAYGLIGCILYYLLYLTILRFLWQLVGARQLSPAARNLVLACFVGAALSLLLGMIGGGDYPPEQVWLLVIFIGSLYGGSGLAEERPHKDISHRDVSPRPPAMGPLPLGRRRFAPTTRS